MSNFDAVSKAFNEAADLQGPARDAYLRDLRLRDPAAADEVESLLGFHSDAEAAPVSPDDENADESGGPAVPSLLDRPVAALLGSAVEDEPPYPEEPSLPPGTLLVADGLGETGDGSTWSFKIISELGRGGMGVVYEAQQSFPSRRVALKLLRGGVGRGGTTVPTHGTSKTAVGGGGGTRASSGAARRLMLEAEALGALHHPGIAHVHAAGTLRLVIDPSVPPAPTGADRWLFISMELVEGPALGAWAKDRSLRERIEMVAELCDAVEHAHQRGVVHRDLKPGNILVEMGGVGVEREGRPTDPPASPSPPVVGQPKVLDFGVARLTSRNRRPDATLNVGRGQLIGTLRYMSPEQAKGGDDKQGNRSVDSRADVYALGAILYELVAGTPPIPVDDTSIVGAVERIVSQTPARPQGLANRLGKRRAADLETVLFKALEKDPRQRYQHAGDLGADLRRVLADEPISARPPTAREQVMRLISRNRVAAAALAAGLMLLIAGAAVATWQAVIATRALDKAREEAAVSRSALRFMERMIASSSPRETRGQDVTLREMLQAAVIEARSMPDDRAAATACRLLADALDDVGEPAAAEPLARRALAINKRLLGDDHPETIEVALSVSHIAAMRGREAEALTDAREIRARCLRLFGPDHVLSLKAAMALEYAIGKNDQASIDEAETLLRDTAARMRRVLPPGDHRIYWALNDLCVLLMTTGRAQEALPIAEEVYNARLRALGEDHPDTIVSMGNLTAALSALGQTQRATDVNAQSIQLATKVFGPDHPSTLYARHHRVQLLMKQGRLADGESEAKAVWEGRARRLGPDTRLTMESRGLHLATILIQGRFAEVEPLIRAFIARNEELFGPRDDDTLLAVTLLHDLAEGKGDQQELAAVVKRLKGTRFDPTNAQQLPPIKPQDENKPSEPRP